MNQSGQVWIANGKPNYKVVFFGGKVLEGRVLGVPPLNKKLTKQPEEKSMHRKMSL